MTTTYSEFLTKVLRLIDGEDITGSEIPTQSLATMANLAERRIYREARTRYNEKAWGITATSNLAALPADFMASSVIHFGKRPLLPKAENWIIDYLNDNPSGGDTTYFCKAGGNLQFAPAVADGTALQGRYFYKFADLSESTIAANTLFQAAEDLFVYATLVESVPFFGQDARVPLWEAKYNAILASVNLLDHRGAFSAGRVSRGTSTRTMR